MASEQLYLGKARYLGRVHLGVSEAACSYRTWRRLWRVSEATAPRPLCSQSMIPDASG